MVKDAQMHLHLKFHENPAFFKRKKNAVKSTTLKLEKTN